MALNSLWRWFSPRPSNPIRKTRATCRPILETLEERSMPAGLVLLQAGLLTIQGTEAADLVVVSLQEDELVVSYSGGAMTWQQFDRAHVQKIIFHGRGGADRLLNFTDVACQAFGGPGNDFLFGGSGRDVFFGGKGNDILRGNRGNDLLRGGPGDDLLWGGRGDDVLRGNRGNDLLFGGPGRNRLFDVPGQAAAPPPASADAEAPRVVIQAPMPGQVTRGTVTVTGRVTDDRSGVAAVEEQVDTGAFGAVAFDGAGSFRFSVTLADGAHTVRLRATDRAGNAAGAEVSFTVDTSTPPDPAAVAPPVDPTVATSLAAATQFLYTGPDPIQVGVAEGTIEARRVAVLRGNVTDRDGAPLGGVAVTILGHAEFGSTRTRADGMFDVAVNGGGLLTVSYAKDGFLTVQRQVDVPWQDFAWLPDVMLTPLDSQVTAIDLAAGTPIQVARGSSVTDADGTRQATLFFAQGTGAEMVMPDGSTQPLSSLHVRATEFTVGPNGPDAMPGELPPQSGYTYAVELSVDEAQAAGATEVRFDQPVSFYVDNFLGFPVGGIVPAGYYDRTRGQWIASQNGRVIQILSEADGTVELDTDGDGSADDAVALAALGITDAERLQLAATYDPNQSLWRVPMAHFTPWDHNWPFGLPSGARAPGRPQPTPQELPKPCLTDGSIIESQNQLLGEDLPVSGTPFTLHYHSNRVPGHVAELDVSLSGADLPAGVKRIDYEVNIAGQRTQHSVAAAANLSASFAWDGKDAYGRYLQGDQPVTICISYIYDAVYLAPGVFAQSFGTASSAPGVSITANTARREIAFTQCIYATLGRTDSLGAGLGGWSLNVHHRFDPAFQELLLGDGSRRSASDVNAVVTTVAGGTGGTFGDGGPATRAQISNPQGLAFAADGSLYIAHGLFLRRVAPDGIISTVAKSADGFGPMASVATAPDGSVYFGYTNFNASSANGIARLAPDGTIAHVAGGPRGFAGDGGPAATARLADPTGLAVAPDGSLYVADNANHRVRRIGPDGIITTVAGTGRRGYGGDGGAATAAQLNRPHNVAIGPDGSVYVSDSFNDRIRRIGPDGIITTVVGNGQQGTDGDGGQAIQARLHAPSALSVGPDGSIYLAMTPSSSTSDTQRVRRVGPDGIITTVAGTGAFGGSNDNTPATRAKFEFIKALAVDPRGQLFIADSTWRVQRVGSTLGGASVTDNVIPSEDGSQLFVFDSEGRHLRTTNALNGTVLFSFTYDPAGYLTEVRDAEGDVTRIERDAAGNPLALVAPGGQRTDLALNSDGYLARMTNPVGQTIALGYADGGLLTSLTDPNGGEHRFSYDLRGRLTRDEDPSGGFTALARTEAANGFSVTLTNSTGEESTYLVEYLPTGEQRLVNTAHGDQTIEVRISTDGSRRVTYPDGTVATLVTGPDPRFGMQVPILQSLTVTTPGGITTTTTGSRTVTLADPSNPLSLLTMTDTRTINGRAFTRTFDAVQNRIVYESPEGRQMITTLDGQGRTIKIESNGLGTVQVTYDAQGRVTTLTEGTGAEARVSSAGFNAQNQLVSLTDAVSRTFSFTRDAAGRVLNGLLPDGGEIGFTYDASGSVATITPPGRSAHGFTYDDASLAATYTAPDLGPGSEQTVYVYDTEQRPTLFTQPDGSTVSFAYDEDHLSKMVLPTGTVSYDYDHDTGNLERVTAPDGGTVSYTHVANLMTGMTWAGDVAGSVGFAFDNDLRLVSERINAGQTVGFAYDRDGALTQAGDLVLNRNPQNALIDGTTLGSVTDSRQYNSFAEASDYRAFVGGAEVIAVQYTRDNLGRIVERIETIDGQSTTYAYEYDLSGRLAAVRHDGALVSRYTYDANGNRLSHTDPNGAITATYDAQDRLQQYGNATYAFTANGELRSKTEGGQTTTYTYDAAGNLLAVTLPDGTQLQYVVDGANRVIGKKVAGVSVQGFLYRDQLNPVAELDAQNNVVSRFVYGTNTHVPDYMIKAGVTYRIIADHVGSVRLVIDTATGAIAQRLDYDEFGNVLRDTNPGFQPFGFAGGIYDTHTKLTRFGARDYDPTTGRWTANDPLGFAGGSANLYGYVNSDPINMTDPSGQILPLVAAGLLGLAGGLINGGGTLLGQVLSGGCINWAKVGISFGVGFAAGAAAPFVVTSLAGAAALGGLANLVEYTAHAGVDPNEEATLGGAVFTTATGAAGGAIGGTPAPTKQWLYTDYDQLLDITEVTDTSADALLREGLQPLPKTAEFGAAVGGGLGTGTPKLPECPC